MTERDDPPIWEQYDDYEDETYSPKGGGGGKKERPTTSITSKKAREEARGNAWESRENEARNRIFSVLRHFPKPDTDPNEFELLNAYRTWLTNALYDETALLSPESTRLEFMRSKTKAGGQNVNKVASAVRLTHAPTGISVRSDTSRDQARNREIAESLLRDKLLGHISDWRIVLTHEGKLDPAHVSYFYLASHSIV